MCGLFESYCQVVVFFYLKFEKKKSYLICHDFDISLFLRLIFVKYCEQNLPLKCHVVLQRVNLLAVDL